MVIELKVPSFGESVREAYLGDWLKREGDEVRQDDPIVVLETDKVTAELPAPASGKLSRVLKTKGQTAAIGEVIGYIEEARVDAPAPSPAPARTAAGPDPSIAEPARVPAAAPPPARTPHVMPSAQRVLSERGIDPSSVAATGPGNRLLKEDALRAPAPSPAPPPPPVAPTPPPSEARPSERVPMSRLRMRIAERLVQSQQTAALLTTFNEIDMSNVIALRSQYQDAFTQKHGVKLGFMSFFVKAAIEALKLVPQVNAEVDGSEIVYHHYFDIGVAVGGGRGLVVPVIRNAETLGFGEIERAITDFASRAKDNRLELEELQGGTFTITNGGVYGSLLATPIVNPPQSGILGLHAINDRPIAVDGQVVIRPMMYVALTYDHRIVDGRESITFLKHIKSCIENPARMLLEI
jgi:2-oxoglutarate dehydrogenase E2 component (dihydrolipoamide succinyltransferase)